MIACMSLELQAVPWSVLCRLCIDLLVVLCSSHLLEHQKRPSPSASFLAVASFSVPCCREGIKGTTESRLSHNLYPLSPIASRVSGVCSSQYSRTAAGHNVLVPGSNQ